MFLGLDLGTSGLRALMVSQDGAPIAVAEAAYTAAHPHTGWSEQDPTLWTQACAQVCAKLKANHRAEFAALRGIGVSGHMHGATVLDASGAPLRPCILWNDTRSHREAAMLDGDPHFRAQSGNIVFPGFTAPKLAWLAKHEPDVFASIDKVLLPKDYLNFWLTGRYASDMSDAAGTAWLDVGARAWSPQLLSASGMRADQMPELFEGTEVIGTIAQERADALGLPQGVQVVAGAADNAAAACGVGAMAQGQGFVSLGTSGVLLAARSGFAPLATSAVHTFCHAVPDQWYQMGVVLAATDCLNWLSRITGQRPADLTRDLGATLPAPTRLQFYPYLSGERTPHNDSALRGGFAGLDIAHTRADMTQAVLMGVCFALRDCKEALAKTGADPTTLLAIGGGAQSKLWVEMLATVLNTPLHVPEQGEAGAAMGAARLAICGVTGRAPSEVMQMPRIAETIHPNADLVADYEAAYQRFHACFAAWNSLS